MAPNPLIQSVAYKTSTEPPNRPVPVIGERHAEDVSNVAYRGSVDHGGPAASNPVYNPALTAENLHDDEKGVIEFDDSPVPVVPLPVRIVGDLTRDGRQRRVIRTRQEVINPGPVPTRIVGQNDARSSVRLSMAQNQDSDGYFIGDNASMTYRDSYYMDSTHAPIELATQGAIYALGGQFFPDSGYATNTRPVFVWVIETLNIPLD